MDDVAYKYFTYRVGNTWRGQQLLSVPQIRTQLMTLNWEYEVFATIQTYDEFGNCKGSPLYFDFDGKPDEVIADARHFVYACEFLLNVSPRIYFSGNRGFHFIIDYFLAHPQCHLLALDFAKEVAPKRTCDMRVYRGQAMLRIPGSLASDRKHYKIQLTRHELMRLCFDEIRELAEHQRTIEDDHDATKIDSVAMEAWNAIAIGKLPVFNNAKILRDTFESVDMDFTHCLERMLFDEPQPGSRNETVFILARYFKLAGFDKETTLKTILGQEHWADWNSLQREVEKIVRSLYNSNRPNNIGCRGETSTAVMMRSYCHPQCFFRQDWPKLNLIDDRSQA